MSETHWRYRDTSLSYLISLCCSDLCISRHEKHCGSTVQGACTGPWTPSSLWSWLHLDVRRPSEEYFIRPVGLAYTSGMRGGCTMQNHQNLGWSISLSCFHAFFSCDDSKWCRSLWCCYPGSMTVCVIMLGMNDETPLHMIQWGCSILVQPDSPLWTGNVRNCRSLAWLNFQSLSCSPSVVHGTPWEEAFCFRISAYTNSERQINTIVIKTY